MNILFAPNSFKECADSLTISRILFQNLSDKEEWKFIIKPLSDGGDGFLSVCESLFDVKSLVYSIKCSYNNQLNEYKILYSESDGNVYIESAELFGIKSIPKIEQKPLSLNSEILGKILLMIKEDVEADKLRVHQVYIGVGGTATIDLGIGACSQLGLTLFDDEGNKLNPIPENFIKVRSFHFSKIKFPFKMHFIVDVDTPLLGEPGAIEIYGKQKGAAKNDLDLIKSGIINLINLFAENFQLKVPSNLNGAGGGLASGISIFYETEIIPAEDFIKKNILENINPSKIDALITGEGKFDHQSFEGKGIGVLLEIFQNVDIPIFIICGMAELNDKLNLPANIRVIELIKFFNNENDSIKNIESGLVNAAAIIKNELRH